MVTAVFVPGNDFFFTRTTHPVPPLTPETFPPPSAHNTTGNIRHAEQSTTRYILRAKLE
jgi:hypothetical protein